MAAFRDSAVLLDAACSVRATYVQARKMAKVDVIHFDGENSFPECAQCGACCGLNVLAMTREEIMRIHSYMLEHDVQPIDRGKSRCCLQSEDGTCMVWPVRAQICRLHHCKVPRIELLKRNPDISVHVDEDLYLVDMHDHFLCGDFTVHEQG